MELCLSEHLIHVLFNAPSLIYHIYILSGDACYLSLVLSYKVSSVPVLSLGGNSKAAAHVAVDLQCWTLQSANRIEYVLTCYYKLACK